MPDRNKEEQVEIEEDLEESPETIIITSTVFPETDEEAKQAQLEADDGAVDLPNVDVIRTTPTSVEVEKVESEEIHDSATG